MENPRLQQVRLQTSLQCKMAVSPIQSVGLDSQVREDIYKQLRSRGLPEWLKTQFRSRLVQELQAPPTPSPSGKQGRAAPLCQLANDLILDHFRSLKYHCSLSVFTAEYADKALSVDHLLSCLHVPVDSSLARMVKESKTSVLVALLLELADHCARRNSSRESASQTDSDMSTWGTLLAHKLSQLDDESTASHLSAMSGQQSVEEQLAAHQHRCEEWAREQVKQEVVRIRKVEIAQMRMAERERNDRELASTRNQLHADYNERLRHLKSVELKLHEQFRNKEEELESSVFLQRQTLLREMDSMRNREALSLHTAAVSRETLSGEAARVETLLEEVREREASLEQVRQQYQRLVEETAHQLEQKARVEALQHQKEQRKGQLALEEMQGEVEKLKACLHESRAECSSLQGRLCAATEQQGKLTRQYDSVQKKLACLGDSPEASMRDLQQQVETLRAQLESTEQHSRQREEELKKSLEEMEVKLTTPPAELVLLEAELLRERKVQREQVCSLTRERDCLQKAVVILKRRSDASEHRLQEKDMQLLHHMRELEDAKAQVAVLEQAVDRLVRRGAPFSLGKKGRGNSPVGKKVLRFASPVQTHIFPAQVTTSPGKDLPTQVRDAPPPHGELDTRSIILRLDQVAKELDESYCRMIDTPSVASESDHLSLHSPGSPLTPHFEQSAANKQVQPHSTSPLSECGTQLAAIATKTVMSTPEEPGFQRQEYKAVKWPLSLDTLWQDQHQMHSPLENTGLTLDSSPPTHTTHPAPPTYTTHPAPPTNTTHPAPPPNTTDPAPPTNTTDPALPIHTTDPAPPTNTTHPAPPIHTTDPAPPTNTTDPALPIHTTDPAPPSSTSDPVPPTNTTDPVLPIDVSNLTSAVPAWEARHSERERQRQQRRMEQEAECRTQLTDLGQQGNTRDSTTPSPGPKGGAPPEVTESVMQRYMQMVMEQTQEVGPTNPAVKPGPTSPEVKPGPASPEVKPRPASPEVKPGPTSPEVKPGPTSPEVAGHSKQMVDEFGLPLSAEEHGSFGGASSDDDPFEDW